MKSALRLYWRNRSPGMVGCHCEESRLKRDDEAISTGHPKLPALDRQDTAASMQLFGSQPCLRLHVGVFVEIHVKNGIIVALLQGLQKRRIPNQSYFSTTITAQIFTGCGLGKWPELPNRAPREISSYAGFH
jgi:hypothetical protein